MSLDCLLHLRWKPVGGLWPGFSPHSPAWRYHPPRAREDKEHTTELSFVTREQSEYIRGETQTARQSSLSSHQQRSSGMFAVIVQVEWLYWIEDLQTDTRDGASHFTEHHQWYEVMKLLRIRRDTASIPSLSQLWATARIPSLLYSWDTTNNWTKLFHGTISKCLFSIYPVLLNFFSMMYISLYKLLDPWFSNVIFHNFLIYYLYLKAHSKNELLFLHGSGSSKFRIIGCEFILRNKLNNDICIISPPI